MTDHNEQLPTSPPPAIANQRVLHYAVLDSAVGYRSGHGLFFVNGKEMGRVPCLAVCQDMNSHQVFLHYCERDWTSLGVASYDSVADAQKRSERIYPGSSTCWIDAHVTEDEAKHYLDEVWAEQRCSFCGKGPDETLVATFEGGGNTRICGRCIAKFHTELNKDTQE
jgi:hypothetical protein